PILFSVLVKILQMKRVLAMNTKLIIRSLTWGLRLVIAAALVVAGLSEAKPASASHDPYLWVTIEAIDCLGSFDFGSQPDFYALITINGRTVKKGHISNRCAIAPNWEVSKYVGSQAMTSVVIRVYDEDGFWSADDVADLKPGAGTSLALTVTREPCAVTGDVVGHCDSQLQSAGRSSDSARIVFRVHYEQCSVGGVCHLP
ncbi:MAG: hypothetical protein ACT4QE_14770, partial [Anaerolineales bacterium]